MSGSLSNVIFQYINFDGISYQWVIVPVANVRKVEREMRTMMKLDVCGDTEPYIHIDLDLHDLDEDADPDNASTTDLKRAHDSLFREIVDDLLGWSNDTKFSRNVMWTYDARRHASKERDAAIADGITGWSRTVQP